MFCVIDCDVISSQKDWVRRGVDVRRAPIQYKDISSYQYRNSIVEIRRS